MIKLIRRPAALLLALLGATLLAPPLPAADGDRAALLLVAKPEMQDPNFAQSVVLVIFPRNAPIGVILNRPTRVTLKEAFPDERHLKDRSDTLYFGGPVQPTGLMFLFQQSNASDKAFGVVDDLYLSGDSSLLDQLLPAKGNRVQRFFLGYSGWSPPQLDFEIAAGAWYVLPADRDTVLRSDPSTLWRDLILRATAVKT